MRIISDQNERIFPASILSILILLMFASDCFADLTSVDMRLKQIESKLQQIENVQKSANEEQDAILAKIKQLKVWARRS